MHSENIARSARNTPMASDCSARLRRSTPARYVFSSRCWRSMFATDCRRSAAKPFAADCRFASISVWSWRPPAS